MSEVKCTHCRESLPRIRDAFCPYCRESFTELASEPVGTAATTHQSQPCGKTTLDAYVELPNVCVICGAEAQDVVRIRFNRQHAARKSLLRFALENSLLKVIFGGAIFGRLIADEAFDERPVNLSLPVCRMHIEDPRLAAINGIPVGRRRVAIEGVHPKFVAAFKDRLQHRWTDLAERVDDVENQSRPRLKRYDYLTGNIEFADHVAAGEPLASVLEEIGAKWKPGNEHLWDEYDIESLIDSDEQRSSLVNCLLYARWTHRTLESSNESIEEASSMVRR